MREKFCVKKKTLLLIAGIVWLMGGGIGFRAAGIFLDIFVAFFYSGVGCALALAGVTFTRNFICYHQLIEKEMEV